MTAQIDKQETEDKLFSLSDILLEEYKALHFETEEFDLDAELGKLPPRPETPVGAEVTAEQRKIYEDELARAEDKRLGIIFKAIHNLKREKRSALCLSGGGIRSATFCLGVLQGLARQNLLDKFHYLSTVSGGGYVGSWLTAWIYHQKGSAEEVFKVLKDNPKKLKTKPEPEQITHLRSYSNLLTPKTGLLSADAWTLVAIYLRNLFLNWLVFIPLVLAILLLPRIYIALINKKFEFVWLKQNTYEISWYFLVAGLLLGALSLAYISSHRPSIRNIPEEPEPAKGVAKPRKKDSDNPIYFRLLFLAPLLASVIFLTVGRAWRLGFEVENAWSASEFAKGGAALTGIAWALTFVLVLIFFKWKVFLAFCKRWERLYELVVVSITGALAGFLLWLLSIPGKLLTIQLSKEQAINKIVEIALAAAAIPGKMLADKPLEYTNFWQEYVWLDGPILMVVFLLMGMLSNGIGSKSIDDEDREWWARAGAWVLIIILIWAFVHALVIWVPNNLPEDWLINVPIGSGGLIAGFVTIIFAISSKTPANDRLAEKAGRLTTLLSLGVKLAAPVFTCFLIVFFSFLTDFLIILIKFLSGIFNKPVKQWLPPFDNWNHLENVDFRELVSRAHDETSVLFLVCLLLVLLAIAAAMSFFINVNQFSLHSLYRNRLIRVYLGASNPNREENSFTGFAPDDDLKMSELRLPDEILWDKHKISRVIKPFHIINMSWNLVNGKKLAWQNRMATTFTVSSLHCGNYLNGYRRSDKYGGEESKPLRARLRKWLFRQEKNKEKSSESVSADEKSKEETKSITLGTAFTISGAAASPNMGYYSSTFVTFLMTLFNARLGWWLGNPSKEKYQKSEPLSALGPIIDEALGKTAEDKDYIYLSDGGHFENLGLYEMVLRRCHYIFVVDASRDPDYKFENLGNAIRRIRVDLGVSIEIVDYPRKQDKPSPYCAIGNIVYSDIDGAEAKNGTLIYIKPNLIGDEPTDIFNYAQDNIQFPHEPTTDLWFSEQQFESYRELGSYAIEKIFGEPKKNADFSDLRDRIETYLGKIRASGKSKRKRAQPNLSAGNGAAQTKAADENNRAPKPKASTGKKRSGS